MNAATQIVLTSQVTTGWKWIAAVIALGVLAILYLVVSVSTNNWNPLKLVEGEDKQPSTSKFQWFIWLTIVLFSYVFLWVLRARQGDYGAINTVPSNLLAVLGFSTVTAVGAKGITVGYLKSGAISQPDPDTAAGGLLVDDSGVPELAKIQMIGFTLVAVLIFLADVLHQARGPHPGAQLPNIDSSLLVLMGISQGGYLGKKLVTITTPVLTAMVPTTGPPGSVVTLTGSSFGGGGGSSRLVLDGNPIKTDSWKDAQITFTIPQQYPDASADWGTLPRVVRIGVDLGGGTRGNEVGLTVTQ
jgi:hypothetical protein